MAKKKKRVHEHRERCGSSPPSWSKASSYERPLSISTSCYTVASVLCESAVATSSARRSCCAGEACHVRSVILYVCISWQLCSEAKALLTSRWWEAISQMRETLCPVTCQQRYGKRCLHGLLHKHSNRKRNASGRHGAALTSTSSPQANVGKCYAQRTAQAFKCGTQTMATVRCAKCFRGESPIPSRYKKKKGLPPSCSIIYQSLSSFLFL